MSDVRIDPAISQLEGGDSSARPKEPVVRIRDAELSALTKLLYTKANKHIGTRSFTRGREPCQLSYASSSIGAQSSFQNPCIRSKIHVAQSKEKVSRYSHRDSLPICANPYETTFSWVSYAAGCRQVFEKRLNSLPCGRAKLDLVLNLNFALFFRSVISMNEC